MNNKGFTLVELLGVIVIISLLTLVASVSVVKLVKDSKNELNKIQKKAIISAAKAWGADNLTLLPSSESDYCIYLTIENLQQYGLIDSEIINPETNSSYNDIKIKISATVSPTSKTIINYDISSTVEMCKSIYELSTNW